jgi:hypothetical protein
LVAIVGGFNLVCLAQIAPLAQQLDVPFRVAAAFAVRVDVIEVQVSGGTTFHAFVSVTLSHCSLYFV